MDTLRAARLVAIVAEIHKRWGQDALVPLSQKPEQNCSGLPTGFPMLDALLAGGGLPCGQLTGVLGDVSSGAMTLCYRALGHTQANGASLRAVYVDLGRSFDGAYAAACGVDLSQLLIVRPESLDDAFDICGDLATRYGTGAILIDTTLLAPWPARRSAGWQRSLGGRRVQSSVLSGLKLEHDYPRFNCTRRSLFIWSGRAGYSGTAASKALRRVYRPETVGWPGAPADDTPARIDAGQIGVERVIACLTTTAEPGQVDHAVS